MVWLSNGKMAKGKTTLDKLAYIFVENSDLERVISEVMELTNEFKQGVNDEK